MFNLKCVHPTVFKEMEKNEKEENEKKKFTSVGSSASSSASVSQACQFNISKFLFSEKITIYKTSVQFKNSVFCNPAMKGLLDEMS